MTSRFHDRPQPPLPAPSSSPRQAWAVWLATGLGVGYGPIMPGTYGSALGVGLYLLLAALVNRLPYPRLFLSLITLALVAASFAIVAIALRSFKVQDPSAVVLDEIVGQLLTLLPLPLAPQNSGSYWMAIATGFVLFRALDALKPYPIWKLERLKGAWGVVADDLGAGVSGAILLSIITQLWWKI